MKKKILMIGFTDEKGRVQRKELRRKLADRQPKIAVKPVPEADYGRPLGDLAGLGSIGSQSGTSFTPTPSPSAAQTNLPRLIVMCGLDEEEREQMLSLFTDVGITRDDLKAILTPTNSSWTVFELAQALQKEHMQLSK